MTDLILWRHGQTDYNLQGRIQGRVDIPLNGTGREQARRAADSIAVLKPTRIVSSPLVRARATAETLASLIGQSVEVDSALAEKSFGDWEGLKDEAFLRRYIETQYVFFDYGLWALFRRAGEVREAQFLGLVGFSPEEPPELGYALLRESRRQGYATEAALAALRYAAEELGFREAQIRVAPENRAGLAAAEKIKEQWNRAGGAPQCRLFIQR